MDAAGARLRACERTGTGTSGESARVGRQGRTPRAAGSAVLVAMTIGIAGTTGVSAALAVDPPSTVAIAGSLVDQAGTSLPGVHLVITEELPPDGGFAGFQTQTGADGSFSATLFAWGTAAGPAEIRINAPQDESITLAVDDRCS